MAPYSTDFKDLQKVYDGPIGRFHREVTEINYNNKTKKMTVVYNLKETIDGFVKYVEDFRR